MSATVRPTPLGYRVRIIKDSTGPNGKRIITWELRYPRFVHAELMTHRLFSRNSASSRAIPNKVLRRAISEMPVLPVYWGKNQRGMQAGEELTGFRRWLAEKVWLLARFSNLFFSWVLGSVLDLHKQIANRLLEPHMFITVLVTATEHDNWFRLRANEKAQPEIRWVAEEMKRLYDTNLSTKLMAGEWHMPFINDIDFKETDEMFFGEGRFDPYGQVELLKKVSVARCARVSYLTHDGRKSFKDDIELHDKLAKDGHWSPFEHVAMAQFSAGKVWSGNFYGWHQYRAVIDRHFTRVGINEINKG